MQPQMFLSDNSVGPKTPGDLACCQPQLPVLAELMCTELPDDVDDEEDVSSLMRSVRRQEELEEEVSVESYLDLVLLHHVDVVGRLKFLESKMERPRDYFRNSPKDEVLPYMRKIVASWMLEVCEEQRCEEAVFPLAVALLDRFLATCTIKKEILQLIACVCLLLASKTRQCNHFSLELLSWYTDNSVSPQSLRAWELMILSQLNWDVNIITANDFVDFLLVRTSGQPLQPNKHSLLIRRHANTFIALCATEPRFVGLKPSLIASSAIYTAMKGMRRHDPKLASTLALIASVSVDQLIHVSTSIDQVISSEMAVLEQQTIDLPHLKGNSAMIGSSKQYSSSSCGMASRQSMSTDVQDVIV